MHSGLPKYTHTMQIKFYNITDTKTVEVRPLIVKFVKIMSKFPGTKIIGSGAFKSNIKNVKDIPTGEASLKSV